MLISFCKSRFGDRYYNNYDLMGMKINKFLLKRTKIIWVSLFLSAIACFHIAAAQISVREEPHHKMLLENEYVRIFDGQVSRGDTTIMHTHTANSVVLFLSKSTFGIQNVGENPVITKVNPGDIIYRDFGDHPVKHIVWNQSIPLLHFMVIEQAKIKPDDDSCSILAEAGITLALSQKMINVYNMDIKKGRRWLLPKSTCAFLLINISGMVRVVYDGIICNLQANDFVFIPPQREIQIDGNNYEGSRSVLLELK